MSLETPIKIRTLQRKLYRKAKEEPDYRFYLLYDKIYREDILDSRLRTGEVQPGRTGRRWADLHGRSNRKGWGSGWPGIREELRTKRYKPQPVRRVMIPKPGGGERPLGIPTIRDRVVQTAAKLVLEPIFEADLEPCAYGYRPKRSAQDAIRKVHELLCAGYTEVVDADLSKYFDTIPHRELMQCVARRIVDREVLRLLKAWLKVPVEERDDKGNRRLTGGKGSSLRDPAGWGGEPAAGQPVHEPVSEVLADHRTGESFRAQVVNYADDFVILTRRHAAEARDWTRKVMSRPGTDPERGEDQHSRKPAGRVLTFWDTRWGRSAIGKMAMSTWAQVRRRRAWRGCGRRWQRF